MAEEVGVAFVSLVPSARGFGRKTQAAVRTELAGKDISIPVKPDVDRSVLARALTGFGGDAGKSFADEFTRDAQGRLRDSRGRFVSEDKLRVQTDVDDGQLRRELREAILATQATRPSITVNVKLNGNALRRALAGSVGKEGGRIGNVFSSAFSAAIQNPLITAVVAALAAGLIPTATLTAAATLLGVTLGGVFFGAFLLRNDPLIRKTANEFWTRLNAGLVRAAQPLKVPLLEAMETLFKTLKGLEPDIRAFFQAVAPFIPQLAEGVSGFLKAFTPDLVTAVKASAPVIEQLSLALPDLGDALGQFLTSMALVAPQAATFFGQFLRFTADVIRGLGSAIGFLARLSDEFVAFLKFTGELIKEVVLGWAIIFGQVRAEISRNISVLIHVIQGFIDLIQPKWDSFWRHLIPSTTSIGLNTVVGLAKGLPGRIKAAVGGLGDLLRQAGRNVVQGLIDGIKSKFGPLASTASSLAGIIRDYLPFSPAKEGPLSGSGNPYRSGQVIADMLAGGMRSGLSTVSSASDQLAGAVGAGGMNRGGSALAAAPTQVVISSDGGRFSDLLIEVLRGAVRDKGGNVQFALGTGRA